MVAEVLDSVGVPEFFASGLLRVEALRGDLVRYVLFREICGPGGPVQEPIITFIMPRCAVGPAIELTLCTLGAGTVLPTIAVAVPRLLC